MFPCTFVWFAMEFEDLHCFETRGKALARRLKAPEEGLRSFETPVKGVSNGRMRGLSRICIVLKRVARPVRVVSRGLRRSCGALRRPSRASQTAACAAVRGSVLFSTARHGQDRRHVGPRHASTAKLKRSPCNKTSLRRLSTASQAAGCTELKKFA